MTVLRVDSLHVHYGTIHAVQGISFSLEEREIVSIVGSNGAGKSTVMWTLAGVAERSGGTVELFGRPLPVKPHEVVARGLALVPERRRLFSALTVEENLVMGAYRRKKDARVAEDMERCFRLFPILKQRLKQRSGTLSGGSSRCWPSQGPSWEVPGSSFWTNPPSAWRPSWWTPSWRPFCRSGTGG